MKHTPAHNLWEPSILKIKREWGTFFLRLVWKHKRGWRSAGKNSQESAFTFTQQRNRHGESGCSDPRRIQNYQRLISSWLQFTRHKNPQPKLQPADRLSITFSSFDRVLSAFQVKSTEEKFSPTLYSLDLQFQLLTVINPKSEFSQHRPELRNRKEISSDPSGSKLPHSLNMGELNHTYLCIHLTTHKTPLNIGKY